MTNTYKLLILAVFFLTSSTYAKITVNISNSLKDNSHMKFITHVSSPSSYTNALALNIDNSQIIRIRELIELNLDIKLDFFKGWNINGEAHVTTISPPEFVNQLRKYISMNRINEIAIEQRIQLANIKILGIGSGHTLIEGKKETTFFLIVDSKKLRSIRHKIFQEFTSRGGNPKDFDPTWFFPHITIGYTKTDIHENSGLLKNLKFSYDNRYEIKIY
jgi:2'-5' RNA ligase